MSQYKDFENYSLSTQRRILQALQHNEENNLFMSTDSVS